MNSLSLFKCTAAFPTQNHLLHRNLYSVSRNSNVQISNQKQLERVTKQLFSYTEVIVNDRVIHGIKDGSSNLEIDVFVPSLKLGFEFQGSQHYFTENFSQIDVKDQQKRDIKKDELAKLKDITLISVPFWWDGSANSLVATIQQYRPELFRDYKPYVPIPRDPPEKVIKLYQRGIRGFGELTQATFYTKDTNPQNWFLFEKYDGIRAFWNPQSRTFYSRYGREFKLPQDIINAMPTDLPELDGEFWFGRGTFNESIKISNRTDPLNISWEKFKYMVFDLPTKNDSSYKERYLRLKDIIPVDHSFITVAPMIVCKGRAHLEDYSKEIIQNGGEGIILRNPDALYKQGSSKDFIKFKVLRDAEAKVIKRVSDTHWVCELPNGETVELPSKDLVELDNDDIVSYRYTRFTNKNGRNIPLSAEIFRVRRDLTWEDVVKNDKQKRRSYKIKLPDKPVYKKNEKGYWNSKENCKKFFDEFAAEKGFDPTTLDSWYNVNISDIEAKKGGYGLLSHYKGSLRSALIDVYPHSNWDVMRFRRHNFWTDPQTCRKHLILFAQQKGFDPFVAENWYKITRKDIEKNLKGGAGLLKHFKWNVKNAVTSIFPEIHWDNNLKRKHTHWSSDQEKAKSWFVAFAKEKGFDPLDSKKWKSVTVKDVTEMGGKDILQQYGGLRNAIRSLFPQQNTAPIKIFQLKAKV